MKEEENAEISFEPVECEQHGHFYACGFVRSNPGGHLLSATLAQVTREIRDMEIFTDDTWVVTFPKCGTTWMQEMAWLLKSDLDFQKAKEITLHDRFPFLEASAMAEDFSKLVLDEDIPVNASIAAVKNMPRPRFIKTHLPMRFLPKQIWTVKPKMIYVSREVKDVIVSYFHHKRFFYGYKADFETFCKSFMKNEILFCPFWGHIKDFWGLRNEENILFVTYEDMQKDLAVVVQLVAKLLLEKELPDEQVQKLCTHLNFKEMKNNKSVNFEAYAEVLKAKNISSDESCCFIREGKSGSWRSEMSEALAMEVDDWSKSELRGSEYFKEVFGA
ncbi:luciferin sulfotransferase-like [Neocloeon triangulifer]|uniref:luciferin sulfotransferase-like n=1 Tax=Neocloeon triangulifer TaxID=2078957 RepID=UPI00286EBAFD|nr:luciferin sulfotransferase-like [Neocloeon triangulifer]